MQKYQNLITALLIENKKAARCYQHRAADMTRIMPYCTYILP